MHGALATDLEALFDGSIAQPPGEEERAGDEVIALADRPVSKGGHFAHANPRAALVRLTTFRVRQLRPDLDARHALVSPSLKGQRDRERGGPSLPSSAHST